MAADSKKLKQVIYYNMEEKAGLEGNAHYHFGHDPLYQFQPGTSAGPHELGIVYDPASDQARISFKVGNVAFIKELDARLARTIARNIARDNIEQSTEWVKYTMEIPKFAAAHNAFALALKGVLDQNRYRLPSLVQENFEKDNAEYALSCDGGQLWIPEYVFHGAQYELLIAGYDLEGFETPEGLLEYAQRLVDIEAALKQKKFNAAGKNEGRHIDFRIQAHAESEERVKEDLEAIIGILE